VFEAVTIVAIWVLYALRRTITNEATLLAAAAAVTALVAFDRVLSPQYLIWIVPFVLLVRGSRGFYAGALLLLALGLTQTWFPRHYWTLADDHAAPWSWYLLARDLTLVAITVMLLLELSRGRGSEAGTERWPAARQAGA
jgi:hypothetical protein